MIMVLLIREIRLKSYLFFILINFEAGTIKKETNLYI